MSGANKLLTGSGGSVTIQAKDGLTTDEIMEFFGYDATGVALTGADLTALNIVGANPYATLYPDGSIVGGSDNGTFIMWANGKLECYVKVTETVALTSASGTIFKASIIYKTFPIVFTARIGAHGSITDPAGGAASVWVSRLYDTSTQVGVNLMSSVSQSVSVDAMITVIGRWK